MKKYILCFLVPLISHAQLSDEGYLNRLSQALKGHSPTSLEYSELNIARERNQTESYLNGKITEYLSNPVYADKMRSRIVEMLKLKSSNTAFLASREELAYNESPSKDRDNSTDEFLTQLIRQNKSWDSLLTSGSYKVFTADQEYFGITDSKFYEFVMDLETKKSILEKNNKYSVPLEFSDADGRVAGVLTTPRFFERYATTAINKNRRRAAAIFKNFLCDNMMAAVPDPSENKSRIVEIQYPKAKQESFTEAEIRAIMQDDSHGSLADCKSCHDKLDPMGNVFLGSRTILSKFQWPGALAYKNSKNEDISIKVQNIRELGKAITQQEDYVTCQVRHFWGWFIGNDIPLSSEVLSELSQKFNEVGRKPNDFVRHLVKRSEFKNRLVENPEQKINRQVYNLFKKCQSCHEGQADEVTGEALLNLAVWPLGKNHESEKNTGFWLDRVSEKLDLKNGGRDRSMPPAKSNWNLTRDELALIKTWISLESKKQVRP